MIQHQRSLGTAASAAVLFPFLCLFAAVLCPAHGAANLSAEPLRLNLPADKLAASLTLGNNGSTAVTVQAEVVRWEQVDGEERFSPAPELVVSPPIFSIGPAARQIIRVGRLKRVTPPAREIAYRLRLAEIPPDDAVRERAVATVLHLSFPVFVAPQDARALPEVSLTPQAAGTDLKIAAGNSGRVHGKLIALRLRRDGQTLAERNFNHYVLAESQRELIWQGALTGVPPGVAELEVTFGDRKQTRLPLNIGTAPVDAPAPAP